MQITYKCYQEDLEAVEDETLRIRSFVEMNVQEQVYDLVKTFIVQNA
jgi:carbonic anhydrase